MNAKQLVELVQTKIYFIRDQKVMLDVDIAELYGVETKRINEAVRNNPEKFPDDFTFELDHEEQASLRSKISTLEKGSGRHRKYPTKAFTEQGVYIPHKVINCEFCYLLSGVRCQVTDNRIYALVQYILSINQKKV